ncbi:TPA: TraC family protein [Legionella pneumophila]
MGLTLAAFRDKARDLLHQAATLLGETSGIKPASLHAHDKAHESCALDLPSIKALLPYETVNERGFFVNRNSMGFGLELLPMAGSDESLMSSLSQLFKNKLSVGTDCTVLLYKHPWLGASLSQNYEPILKQGGIYAELARESLKYHLNAIKKGYKNGRNVPAGLSDYCCYLFVSRPMQQDVEEQIHLLQADFESELKVAGFGFRRFEEDDFKVLMRALFSPDFNELSWPVINESHGLISEGIPNPSTKIEIEDECIQASIVDLKGEIQKTRLVNCELSDYPVKPFALWQTPDLFANLLDTEQGIQCPFLEDVWLNKIRYSFPLGKTVRKLGWAIQVM